MSIDTGYTKETIEKLLERFRNIHKIILYNQENKEILVKNWHKYNWTKSEKLDKPLLKEIENVKTIDFKVFLIDLYNKRDTVSIPYTYTMDTTVSVTVSDTVKNNNGKFKKPSIEEIEEYCKERNNNVNAEAFYNFYESKGWKVGNQSMKNWKACIITWEKRTKKETNIEQRSYTEKDFNGFYAN